MGKVTYRVTNWKTYNESLVRRGSLTMWVDQDLIENWNHPPKEPVRRGCPRKYHPDVLLLSLVIRYRFGLPYRQTESFLASLLRLMGSDLQVPDYSYLCKQVAKLGLEFEFEFEYGKRAHSEGVFSRFKRIFGGQLQSRKSQQQFKEIMTKISILNRFTGMGLSVAVSVV